MEDQQLNSLVKQQAQKSGISQKDAAKALKKLKQGGMMAQIAPQLHEQFMSMDPNMTPQERLRQKIRTKQNSRLSKITKAYTYEKQREQVAERKERELEEKKKAKEAAKRSHRNHRRKLNELEKRLGSITEDLYCECLRKLNGTLSSDERNRCNNIIEIYSRQHGFKDKIDIDEDLSDLMQ